MSVSEMHPLVAICQPFGQHPASVGRRIAPLSELSRQLCTSATITHLAVHSSVSELRKSITPLSHSIVLLHHQGRARQFNKSQLIQARHLSSPALQPPPQSLSFLVGHRISIVASHCCIIEAQLADFSLQSVTWAEITFPSSSSRFSSLRAFPNRSTRAQCFIVKVEPAILVLQDTARLSVNHLL